MSGKRVVQNHVPIGQSGEFALEAGGTAPIPAVAAQPVSLYRSHNHPKRVFRASNIQALEPVSSALHYDRAANLWGVQRLSRHSRAATYRMEPARLKSVKSQYPGHVHRSEFGHRGRRSIHGPMVGRWRKE